MASTTPPAEHQNTEVFPWLKTLPLAPEYHPTLAEFQDPIAYIFKIEKEASTYGICKIVPPLPAAPKKTAIANANRSLAARNPSECSGPPTFATRQQQIGFCPRKHRPVSKPVWQSGERYTLPEFETKAKNFEKSYLKKPSKKGLTALEVETLYWKANGDKPFSVEYANDMPGSAFAPVVSGGRGNSKKKTEAVTVGETAWNMRGVSRAKGSLLRFMKEEIPGVTSPMVYVAMMFSWFAWHVEDHDLHSLNYLHAGAGKTWYGVPRDAAVAFEEVVRVSGYGGEINPLDGLPIVVPFTVYNWPPRPSINDLVLRFTAKCQNVIPLIGCFRGPLEVTFAILGEKTTVMSPEVLISAGIPCCRLVQNAGEFVVTFPRAYHSGFSHGHNLGEAANIATPGWLMVAKDAAIRRASINCPPMVSHFQLLYDLALSLCSRIPRSVGTEPRSSRLKDKKKGEGETLIKELFVEDVMRNNDLLHILGEGSSVVLLPQNSLEEIRASERLASRNIILDRKLGVNQLASLYPVKGKLSSLPNGNRLSFLSGSDSACTLASQIHKVGAGTESTAEGDRLSDKGLFSCVTCGILSFACVAIVQPREAAANYLMSADCSIFNDHYVGPLVHSDGCTVSTAPSNPSEMNSRSAGRMGKSVRDGLFDVPVQAADDIQTEQHGTEVFIDAEAKETASALGLLALNYGNSSDSEEEDIEADIPVYSSRTKSKDFAPVVGLQSESSSDDVSLQVVDSYEDDGHLISNFRGRYQSFECSDEFESGNRASKESNSLGSGFRQQMKSSPADSNFSPLTRKAVRSSSNAIDPYENSFAPRSDVDSSRLHVFCLQHAVEVEQRLRPIGGAHILLLCHPDYPELENEAKSVAEEMGIDYFWNDVGFREAAKDDEETIQLALESADSLHGNGDWAVKLGINLYYSANLSRSPLYSKQMPYNSIIYKAFGRSSTVNSPAKRKVHGKGPGKQKKIVVAGKWCGKVWMSNQVHSLLAERDTEEEEEKGFRAWSKPNVVRHDREGVLEISHPAETNSMLNAEEEEEDRGFRAWSKPRVVRHEKERLLEITHTDETNSGIRKSGRKRKSTIKAEANLKAKRLKMEDPVNDADDSQEEAYQKQKRSIRNKKMEPETPLLLKSRIRNTRQFDSDIEEEEEEVEGGPSTRLRKRAPKPSKHLVEKPIESKSMLKKPTSSKKEKKSPAAAQNNMKMREEEGEYQCDVEGCAMAFSSKQELVMHKRNICPVKGCGKKFFSHKYLVQHRRVHMDDRPLKCPWKGCKMSFKWAWARTEHIRVHTGARPYVCEEAGCGQTFRFVSDFSRHKRKTGHVGKKGKR